METIKGEYFYGIIVIGLRKGYTDSVIETEDVLKELARLQQELIAKEGVYLSANCYESLIVLSAIREPHLNIRFINYPRFPIDKKSFRNGVEWIGGNLMRCFEQNRILIEYNDEIVMHQMSQRIDRL